MYVLKSSLTVKLCQALTLLNLISMSLNPGLENANVS